MNINFKIICNSITTRFFLFVVILLLSSCSKEPYVAEYDENDQFTFSSSIDANTKGVSNSKFRDGDIIGIFAVKRTNSAVQEPLTQDVLAKAYAKNIPFSYNASSLHWEPMDGGIGIALPYDNSALDFYAYYPYDATIGSAGKDNFMSIPLNIASDQSSNDDFDRADLLYGGGSVRSGRKNVHLKFRHLLCYIRMTLIADGVDEDNIKSVYLTQKYTQIKLDFSKGEVSVDETKPEERVNILFNHEESEQGVYIYSAIVAPQSISPDEEDFEILCSFSGVPQGYTSRLNPMVETIIGGESYHPTVVMATPPARVKIDLEQLLNETNSLQPTTWSYAIMNEGRKLGEVCREYIRATPTVDESGTVGVSADAQMIVAYPLASNGKDIDMERGVVLAVLKDDASGDPTGTIDYSALNGGDVSFFYNRNGDEVALYVPGNRTSLVREFYIYNRVIHLTPPMKEDGITPVAPIVRTRVVADYLQLGDDTKYGIVKLGMTHITQQDLAVTKYIDKSNIMYTDFGQWKSASTANINSPLYTIHNDTYYYNYATIRQMSKIATGWVVSSEKQTLFMSYLGDRAEFGKTIRLQIEDQTNNRGKGNNKTGLGMSPTDYINGNGNAQNNGSSFMWLYSDDSAIIRAYIVNSANELENHRPLGVEDGVVIRLIRAKY